MIADATYFTTIGNLKLNPQTGFADWNQDFPNPVDFYLLLDGHAILPTNNENFGQVNDPHINAQVDEARRRRRRAQLSTVAAQWQALDEYVGQEGLRRRVRLPDVPVFTSNRINYAALVFQPSTAGTGRRSQLK